MIWRSKEKTQEPHETKRDKMDHVMRKKLNKIAVYYSFWLYKS